MRTLLSLVLVPCALFLAACTSTSSGSSGTTTTTGSGGATGSTSATTTTATTATTAMGSGGATVIGATPYQLTYVRTGSLKGADEVTVVDVAARTLSYQATYTAYPPVPEQQATLAQTDVDTLTAAIEQADLEHAGGPYHCAGCIDQFSYEAKLVIGGTTYDVRWEDDTDASLEAMGSAILQLDAQKFPSAGL